VSAKGAGSDPRALRVSGRAARRAHRESFGTTLRLQTEPTLANARRGFFLVFVNPFSEWHEGTQFEPAVAARALGAELRALGYHNARDGRARLTALRGHLAPVLDAGDVAARSSPVQAS